MKATFFGIISILITGHIRQRVCVCVQLKTVRFLGQHCYYCIFHYNFRDFGNLC